MSKDAEKQHPVHFKDTFFTCVRLIKLIWSIDRFLLTSAVIATVIPSIIPFINIYIYKLIIDIVVATVKGAPLHTETLYWLLVTRIVTYFLQDASYRTQEYVEQLLWNKIPIRLDEIIFTKIASLDMQYFEDSNFKDLLQKVRDNHFIRPQQVVSSLIFSLQSTVQVLIAFFALINLNPFLLLLTGVIAIPEFINQTKRAKISWGVWAHNTPNRKRYWYLANMLQSAFSLKELRIFNISPRFISEIKNVDTKFYNDNKKLLRRNYAFGVSINGFTTLVFVGIEIYVVFQALARKITVGDISFYTGVVSNFQQGLSGLFRNLNGIFENSLYVQSIFDLLDSRSLLPKPINPVKLVLDKPPTIEFKNVTFSYPGTTTKVLNDFSLKIASQEKVALVGENGAGKSTIIKLLARFYDVNDGEILINDVNIKDLDLDSWYNYLGILFQDFNRYEDTVLDNIGFGRIDSGKEETKIKNAAASAGAHELIEKLDKGYKQMLGTTFEDGKDLSTGQWQKIALSRAFFRNAEVLVLDEPTAAMDAKAESEIFERVRKLSQDKSVIIISHRFSTVRHADRVIVLENGSIREEGNHEALMKQKGLYAELFSLQAKAYR